MNPDACAEPSLALIRRNIRLRKNAEQSCAGRARGSRKRQALPLRLQAGAPGDAAEATILALPADLLVQVFSKLGLKAHRHVLPLVCKQWCGGPLCCIACHGMLCHARCMGLMATFPSYQP